MSHSHHSGGHPTLLSYVVVFAALAVFTIVSFVANALANNGMIGVATSFVIIMLVAVIKASLVGAWFMHLKFDWGRVGFMLIPAFVLAVMMMLVLMPDIVLAWHQ